MAEGEKRARTLFLTYEADDDTAETFMIVLGSIAENFRGVKIEEFQDDTVFEDGSDAMQVLHDLATSSKRLTPEQKRTLDEFSAALSDWDGET